MENITYVIELRINDLILISSTFCEDARMDINQLLFFEKREETNLYCTVVNDSGQVYYCESDDGEQPDGKWKLVNLDLHALSQLH